MPVSPGMLRDIIMYLSSWSPRWESYLYKAMFSLAFHGCARIGEVANSNGDMSHILLAEDVSFVRKGGRVVRLDVKYRSYKHKKVGGQQMVHVLATGSSVCPVRMLQDYLQLGRRPTTAKYLFTDMEGHPVRSSAVGTALQRCVRALGLDVKNFSFHSFRIGGATAAANLGASDEQLRQLGRWSSNAFRKYVRPAGFSFAQLQ